MRSGDIIDLLQLAFVVAVIAVPIGLMAVAGLRVAFP